MKTLVSQRLSTNYDVYAPFRQAQGLPYMPRPDVVVVDESVDGRKKSGARTGSGLLIGVGIVVLLLYSFRFEKRGKK